MPSDITYKSRLKGKSLRQGGGTSSSLKKHLASTRLVTLECGVSWHVGHESQIRQLVMYQVVSMLSWVAATGQWRRCVVEKKYTGGSKTVVLLTKHHIRAAIRLQRDPVMIRRFGYSWHGCRSIAAGKDLVSACDK